MQTTDLEPNKLLIRQPFSEQYSLLITSETKAVTTYLTSKVKIRWNVEYFNIEEQSLECRLIKTEHSLIEKNNSIIDEIIAISELFGRIYSELHVRINQDGQVLEVLNQDLIKEKWKQIKDRLNQQLDESQVKEIFTINDSIINNPSKIKDAVQAQEFFQVYFQHVFNKDLPYTDNSFAGLNLFNTANLVWRFKTTSDHPVSSGVNQIRARFEGEPSTKLPIGFYNKAYGQFADKIDISTLRTNLNQRGEHFIEYHTGRVFKASIKKEETADPKDLFSKIRYEMISDTQQKTPDLLKRTKHKDPDKTFLAE